MGHVSNVPGAMESCSTFLYVWHVGNVPHVTASPISVRPEGIIQGFLLNPLGEEYDGLLPTVATRGILPPKSVTEP